LCTNWLLAHQLAAERHFDLDRRHPSQISDPIASASPPQRHGLNDTASTALLNDVIKERRDSSTA
jgi:hypothetical protein